MGVISTVAGAAPVFVTVTNSEMCASLWPPARIHCLAAPGTPVVTVNPTGSDGRRKRATRRRAAALRARRAATWIGEATASSRAATTGSSFREVTLAQRRAAADSSGAGA